jgi:hypothetical protein
LILVVIQALILFLIPTIPGSDSYIDLGSDSVIEQGSDSGID